MFRSLLDPDIAELAAEMTAGHRLHRLLVWPGAYAASLFIPLGLGGRR